MNFYAKISFNDQEYASSFTCRESLIYRIEETILTKKYKTRKPFKFVLELRHRGDDDCDDPKCKGCTKKHYINLEKVPYLLKFLKEYFWSRRLDYKVEECVKSEYGSGVFRLTVSGNVYKVPNGLFFSALIYYITVILRNVEKDDIDVLLLKSVYPHMDYTSNAVLMLMYKNIIKDSEYGFAKLGESKSYSGPRQFLKMKVLPDCANDKNPQNNPLFNSILKFLHGLPKEIKEKLVKEGEIRAKLIVDNIKTRDLKPSDVLMRNDIVTITNKLGDFDEIVVESWAGKEFSEIIINYAKNGTTVKGVREVYSWD